MVQFSVQALAYTRCIVITVVELDCTAATQGADKIALLDKKHDWNNWSYEPDLNGFCRRICNDEFSKIVVAKRVVGFSGLGFPSIGN